MLHVRLVPNCLTWWFLWIFCRQTDEDLLEDVEDPKVLVHKSTLRKYETDLNEAQDKLDELTAQLESTRSHMLAETVIFFDLVSPPVSFYISSGSRKQSRSSFACGHC